MREMKFNICNGIALVNHTEHFKESFSLATDIKDTEFYKRVINKQAFLTVLKEFRSLHQFNF